LAGITDLNRVIFAATKIAVIPPSELARRLVFHHIQWAEEYW
jgi:hypothetical protein